MLLSICCGSALLALAPVVHSRTQQASAIEWFDGLLTNALGRARHEGKRVAIYFWSPRSANSSRLYQETILTPLGAEALGRFLCLSADTSQTKGESLLARYRLPTLPTVLVLAENGTPEDALAGFLPPARFAAELERIASGVDTISDLRRQLAQPPPELAPRLEIVLRLALKLVDAGSAEEGAALLAQIESEDPDGRTVTGARVAFWKLRDALAAPYFASSDPAQLQLEPMHRHVETIEHPAVRVEAYTWLARMHDERQEHGRARAASRAAWSDVAPIEQLEHGTRLVVRLWGERDQLDADERAFAGEVAGVVESLARGRLAAGEKEALDDQDRRLVAHGIAARALALALAGDSKGAERLAAEAFDLTPGDHELRRLLDQALGL